MAGDVIGLQMGLSFASFIDPQNSSQSPLVGSFLGLLAMLVFLAVNGHAYLISSVADSFTTWPVGASMGNAASGSATAPFGARTLAAWGSELFRIGLHVSLPVLTALLIGLGYAIGGQTGLVIALMLAGFMNFASCWWSDRIVLPRSRKCPSSAKRYVARWRANRREPSMCGWSG